MRGWSDATSNVPYITPDGIPEATTCRSLLIPSSSDWLAIFSGALTELTKAYNWERVGGITVAEAVAVCAAVIDGYYTDDCENSCSLPGGSPVFRIGLNGHVEQLVNGEWVEPQGIYTIPPVPGRSEPTPEERRCLAAENAANVLEQVYENLTDSFNEDRTLEEAVGALLIFIATKFFWLAPIAAGLLILALAAMEIVYLLIEIFGADLWTAGFTDALVCILYDCATDDGEVVTFDYTCVQEGLADKLEHFDLDAAQLRLLVQLGFILNAIGGADALNHAGATTEVETGDCDCGTAYKWDFTVSPADWTVVADRGSGCCFGGLGFVSVYNFGGLGNTEIRIASPTQPEKTITRFLVEYSAEGNSDGALYDTPSTGFLFAAPIASPGIVDETTTMLIEAGAWRLDIAIAGADAPITIKSLTVYIVDNDFAGLTGGMVI